jgi:MFS family permease
MLLGGAATGLPLALALVVTEVSSLSAAGLLLGAFAVSAGVSSPIRGRMVDKHGQTKVLVPIALAHLATLLAFAAVAQGDGNELLLVAIVVATGLTFPPVEASIRAVWRDLANSEAELESAYALHAVLNEVVYVLGPLAVGLVVVIASPITALVVVACSRTVGVVVFASTPASRGWRGKPRETGVLGALASPGIRTLITANIALGFVFGILDVGVVAFATAHDARSAAGVALAALAVGSIVGGLLYGTRTWAAPIDRRLLVLYGIFTATLVPLALAPSMATLSGLMLLAGLAVAPYVATQYRLLDLTAPPGTAAEAMNWVATTYAMGAAAGSVVAGLIGEHVGARAALACAALAAGAALLITLLRYSTLRPAKPRGPDEAGKAVTQGSAAEKAPGPA